MTSYGYMVFVDSLASHDILQITAITQYVTFRLFLETNICTPGEESCSYNFKLFALFCASEITRSIMAVSVTVTTLFKDDVI